MPPPSTRASGTRRRILATPLLLAAVLVALLANLATPAPAQPVTGHGHVAGLDLSTPETAARTLVTLWAARDFIGAWLAFDPELQRLMTRAAVTFDLTRILGPEPYPDLYAGIFRQQGLLLPAWAETPERLLSSDSFPYIAALLRGAAFARALPFDLDPAAEIGPAMPIPGAPRPSVRLVLGSGEGAVDLVMRRRGDLWRLTHLEIAGQDVPEVWRDQGD